MANVTVREMLALDAVRPPASTSAIDVLGAWERKLEQDEFHVEILPYIPSASESYPERIMANTDKSRDILSAVGGLVIADCDDMILELDRSVLVHIDQAAELGVPVFLQTPFEEIAPEGAGSPPGETIYMGRQISMIKDRLGEA